MKSYVVIHLAGSEIAQAGVESIKKYSYNKMVITYKP